MDHALARLVDEDTPKLTPEIANGLAVYLMPHAEKHIDSVFRAAAKGFPRGLTYVGWERCTPQEEYDENTKTKNNRRVYDVARSDIYMVKYLFQFQDSTGKVHDLPPRYLYLPYVSDAGTLYLGGSRFNISPILSDRVISVGTDNIFVRLLRDRLTFESQSVHYMEDGRRETVQMAHSLIYHKNSKHKKIQPTVRAVTSLVHYLLCKYGFEDAFLKFAHTKPVIGGPEINSNTYPENEWVICHSTGMRPKGVGKSYWERSPLRVAVKRSEMTAMVRNMLGGFFYVVDHFPQRVEPQYVNNRNMWMILMGEILWSGAINHGKLRDDVADHISSLDEYLDALVVSKLKDLQLSEEIHDIYQLFALIIRNFNDWVISANDTVASMYDKEFSILYYVLQEITFAIFKLYFKLKAASKKELTVKEITATMNLTLRTGLIYSITKGHGEVSTIAVPGDNKAFKITSLLVPQGNSNKLSGKKDRANLNDPAKRLHSSIAEVGGYVNLPKSAPDGRARINPCVQFDAKMVVVRNPARKELLASVQELIRRR